MTIIRLGLNYSVGNALCSVCTGSLPDPRPTECILLTGEAKDDGVAICEDCVLEFYELLWADVDTPDTME